MECPSCQTAIGDSDLCEGCGADLSLFKRVLSSSERPSKALPVAVGELQSDAVPSPSLNQPPRTAPEKTRTYRAVARTQHGSIKKKPKQDGRKHSGPITAAPRHNPFQESSAPHRSPELPPHIPTEEPYRRANDQLSDLDTLFAQLFESLAESDVAPKDEISLSDLIVRERSERLDLLFHLLDESLSPLGQKREFVELARIPPQSEPLISPKLQHTLSQAVRETSESDRGFDERLKTIRARATTETSLPLETLLARAPSPSRLICGLATLTDLLISETLIAILLGLSGEPLPLHTPQLVTIADDISSMTLLITLLLPGLCLYRAVLLLTTGTTLGYSVYGITPVSLDGRLPSRFQLALRAVVSPVLSLLTAPFVFFSRTGERISQFIGTRLITTTQEVLSAEKQPGR